MDGTPDNKGESILLVSKLYDQVGWRAIGQQHHVYTGIGTDMPLSLRAHR